MPSFFWFGFVFFREHHQPGISHKTANPAAAPGIFCGSVSCVRHDLCHRFQPVQPHERAAPKPAIFLRPVPQEIFEEVEQKSSRRNLQGSKSKRKLFFLPPSCFAAFKKTCFFSIFFTKAQASISRKRPRAPPPSGMSHPSPKRTRSIVQEAATGFGEELPTSEHKKKNELEDDVSGIWFGTAGLKDTSSGDVYLPRYQVVKTSTRTYQVRESRGAPPLVAWEMYGTLRVGTTTLNLITTEGGKYSGSVGPAGVSWRDGDEWHRKVVFFFFWWGDG